MMFAVIGHKVMTDSQAHTGRQLISLERWRFCDVINADRFYGPYHFSLS